MSASGWFEELGPRLEETIGGGLRCVDRFLLVEQARTTQDDCAVACGGKPGMLMLARRQVAGRGRLGRAWEHGAGLGLAFTVSLPAMVPERASMALGVAACMGVRAHAEREVGLRWPNDVVEVVRDAGARRPGRKVAGVLIERRRDVLLAGVGINVLHGEEDFPGPLRARAASVRMLGGGRADPAAVLVSTLLELDRALDLDGASLARCWSGLDCLVGNRCTFEHDGARLTGLVRGIDPGSRVVLEVTGEGVRELPALATSLCHDEPIGSG